MTDPYQILGIDKNTSDEQVKTAFLNMQKKYHPDNYEDTPMKGYAQEKMDEITQAFDAIMNERRKSQARQKGAPTITTTAEDTYDNSQEAYGGSQRQNNRQNYGGYGNAGGQSSSFSDVRRMIKDNRLIEAEEILDGVGQNSRDAEWHFLKGTICFSRGWVDDATNYFSTAARMDPNNREYQAALNRVMWQRQGNYGSGPNRQYRESNHPNSTQCTGCDICTGLLCADCCCECMGGDLISCC